MADIKKYLDERNRIDLQTLFENAEQNKKTREAAELEAFHDYINEIGKPNEKVQDLLEKAAAKIKEDKETEAQRRIKEEQEKANEEIEERIRKETGVHKENDLDRVYKAFHKVLFNKE
ncbi:MAG: hypothetical protein GX222_02120 [Ruminococcaceae bacterium]|nr:hypothetical protein [Oscillospiraceae bacterium]